MAANEELLGLLHDALAHVLLARITGGTATAADMSVARGLLKDSNITCAPAAGNAISDLQSALDAKKAARAERRKAMAGSAVPIDFDAAEKQFDFTGSMQ